MKTWLTIHDKVTFSVFIILGIVQVIVAIQSWTLAIDALSPNVSPQKLKRNRWFSGICGIILLISTILIGVLNDKGQFAAETRASVAEDGQKQLLVRLGEVKGMVQTALLTNAPPKTEQLATTTETPQYRQLQNQLQTIDLKIDQALAAAHAAIPKAPPPATTVPTPQINPSSTRDVISNGQLRDRLNDLASEVSRISDSESGKSHTLSMDTIIPHLNRRCPLLTRLT